MTLRDAVRKLAKHNLKRYLLFCISVVFSVSMLGAFGVLLFSSTVTNVLIAGGSTQTFTLAMYVFTMLGMMIFLVYADSIYMKYKMDETGVFLSLGLKQKTVLYMLNQEFCLLFWISALIGILLSVPVAFVSWSCLTFFVSTAETVFSIGWMGVVIDIVFTGFVWALLMLLNGRTVRKTDIIKILKISSENESEKLADPMLCLTGLLGIPICFFLFNRCESRNDFWGEISIFFLGLSLLCLYLLTSEITAIGSFFKKHCQRFYRKNILFFNLVRQKGGGQYTLSLFVSTILIAVAIFGTGFIGAVFLDNYFSIKEDPYDYSLLTSFQQKEIDQAEIEKLARDYNIEIENFKTLDLLLIGRNFQYDEKMSEWSGQYITSVSSYNSLAETKAAVPTGSCLFYVNADGDPSLYTVLEQKALFYHPTLHQEFTLPIAEWVVGSVLLNKNGEISDLFLLNDADFEQLKSSVEQRYQLKYYVFNAPAAASAEAFHAALLQEVVESSDGKILDNFFDSPVRELMKAEGKNVRTDDYYMDYDGNELYAARWWSMYPFVRENALSSQLEMGAVYFLIMFFIAIIAFVSAVMISKQISLIYYYPTFSGCAVGILMINQIILASSSAHPGAVTLIAVLSASAIVMLQIVIYLFLRNRWRLNGSYSA